MKTVVISYSKPNIIVFIFTYSKHTQNLIKPMENVSAFQKIMGYGQYICANMRTSSEAVVWNVYTDKWKIKKWSIDYFELNVPGCFCCPTKTHRENEKTLHVMENMYCPIDNILMYCCVGPCGGDKDLQT